MFHIIIFLLYNIDGDIMSEKVLYILEQIKIIEFKLDNLIYGSIEIRETKNNKYLYCHARENGIQTTKYTYSKLIYKKILGTILMYCIT